MVSGGNVVAQEVESADPVRRTMNFGRCVRLGGRGFLACGVIAPAPPGLHAIKIGNLPRKHNLDATWNGNMQASAEWREYSRFRDQKTPAEDSNLCSLAARNYKPKNTASVLGADFSWGMWRMRLVVRIQ